jgi:hypothetical protein
MTYPPQSGEHEDPDRQVTQPTPSFERPPQPPPAAPWQGPTQPYGSPAQPYGQPAAPTPPPPSQPSYAPPPYAPAPGQPGQGQPAQGQPPYGPPYGTPAQPPYGQYPQPATAPPQKSRVGLIAAVTGVILLVIAGVVAAVLALQSTVLDPAAVERDVAAQFEEREGVAIDLTCDDEMPVESGSTYECTGTTADGEDVTLEIRIEDEDSAAYTWTEP